MENNHGKAGLGNPDPRTGTTGPVGGTFGRVEWAAYRESADARRKENVPPVKGPVHYVIDEDIFASDMWDILEAAGELLLRKHHDYGPHNIGASPGGALNGLRVRMWDKIARVNNLIDKGVQPENESLRDSFLDLLNYSAIALMVIDGKWPTK